MSQATQPKGDVKGFRAFVRKVLAYEPPSKDPKRVAEPKAKYRRSEKKRQPNASVVSPPS